MNTRETSQHQYLGPEISIFLVRAVTKVLDEHTGNQSAPILGAWNINFLSEGINKVEKFWMNTRETSQHQYVGPENDQITRTFIKYSPVK